MNESEAQFLETANNTEKRLGHNKLQLEIENLNKELEKWKIADSEKELKLGLFKQNISQLQKQIVDQASIISQLRSDSDNNPLIQQTSDNLTQIDLLQTEKVSLQRDITTLQNNIREISKQLESANYEKTQLQIQLEKIQSETSNIKTKFDEHTKVLSEKDQVITKLTSKLTNETSVKEKVEAELETLKKEISKIKQDFESVLEEKQETSLQLQETEQQLQLQLQSPSPDLQPNLTQNSIGTVRRKEPGVSKYRKKYY